MLYLYYIKSLQASSAQAIETYDCGPDGTPRVELECRLDAGFRKQLERWERKWEQVLEN